MTGFPFRLRFKCLLHLLASHQIRYMYWWRKYQKNHGFLAKYKFYRYGRKYGIEISREAQIGAGLDLSHPYNITVGSDVVMGNNINLHKGCTIGRENRGKRVGSPHLGNNIYVGVNATIAGKISIGNNVLIAPNNFVNSDVPDNSIVVGNPGKKHISEKATDSYIGFIIDSHKNDVS